MHCLWLEEGTSDSHLSFHPVTSYLHAPRTENTKNTSPLNAALLNASFIQGFELDDVHVDALWHANSIILPAAEYAQAPDADSKIDGARFLVSTIIGLEIGSRVGRALRGPEMLSRGWHSVDIPSGDFSLTPKADILEPGRRLRSSSRGSSSFKAP